MSQSILNKIITGTKHHLNLFTTIEIEQLENRVIERDGKYFVACLVRNKQIQLKPEEVVRQLLLTRLHNDYGYSFDRIFQSWSFFWRSSISPLLQCTAKTRQRR